MPEFTPTTWMLENHEDKSETKQDWEIYAECVRAAMASHSGLIPVNPLLKDKVAYEAFMCMEKPSVTIDGQTFISDPNGKIGPKDGNSVKDKDYYSVKEMEIV